MSTPQPATFTVREGRDRYLCDNGFTLGGYLAPTVTVRVVGIPLTIPNTPDRRKAIPWHDLHHVAAGYGTDWVGEGEIGAWEMRTGCPTLFIFALNATAALFGCCLNPRRVLRAWVLAKGQRSLYRHPIPYEALLAMPLGDLRAHLGMPAAGQTG
ncbi:MAG: hypothetical protein H7338_03155 [Candidatus Sericytochromatia bacterium]|nr:hypothetical protein [Candidatus Sericytochromatia bacterium]